MRKSNHYVAWIMLAGLELRRQKPANVKGPYRLSVQIARPDKRRRDLDNVAFKAVNDLLVSQGVVEDDSLCEMLSARWVTVGEGACVRIEAAGVE